MRVHDCLELANQRLQVFGGKIDVARDLAPLLRLGEDLLEWVFSEIKDDVAVHLHEPAVGVVREARILRAGDQPFYGLIVEAQVQNRLHHSRHRNGGARAHRHEQRIPRVAESLARHLLEMFQVTIDFGAKRRRERALVEIRDAEFGGDREAGRDRKSQVGHLR